MLEIWIFPMSGYSYLPNHIFFHRYMRI